MEDEVMGHLGISRQYERSRERESQRNGYYQFLAGISTRQVGEVLPSLIGSHPSCSTGSEVVKSFDREVKAFHYRLLSDRYKYLFLDGLTVRLKGASGVRKRLLLVAYGIREDGRKELIEFRQATSESEAEWGNFLEDLYRRGIKGEQLALITTDGARELHRALDLVYPYVPRQRCWVHKLRNVAGKVRKRGRFR